MRGKPGSSPKSARQAVEQDRQRLVAEQLRSDGQGLLRRAARDLLRTLRDLIAAVEARMKYRPPG